MRGRIGVAVAGGREACLAAAMTGFVLERAGLDPSVLLGTPAPQLGGWSRDGVGPHLIAEWAGAADDYATLRPPIALLLNVGCDPWVDSRSRWYGDAPAGRSALPSEECDVLAPRPPLLARLPAGGRGRPRAVRVGLAPAGRGLVGDRPARGCGAVPVPRLPPGTVRYRGPSPGPGPSRGGGRPGGGRGLRAPGCAVGVGPPGARRVLRGRAGF